MNPLLDKICSIPITIITIEYLYHQEQALSCLLSLSVGLSMEAAPKMEWYKAQEITFSIDLVGAAKQQLRFLEAVDSAGCLYDGPTLKRAIYR